MKWSVLSAVLSLWLSTEAVTSAAAPPESVAPVPPDEPCYDGSLVVGRTSCRRYGEPWASYAASPPIQGRLGYSYHRYPISVLRFGEGAEDLDLPAHEVELSTPATSLRLALTSGLFHVGIEGSFASEHIDRDPILGPGVAVDITHASYVAGGLVAGLALRLGPLVARGEALWGGRRTSVRLYERVTGTVANAIDSRWLFEPRASLEVYLTPWISLGAWAGADLLSAGARSYGLFLEGKLRAYDGATESPW